MWTIRKRGNAIGRAFFIDGPGGTGKSFLYRALLATVRYRGFIALATASSGVAALLHPGGRTAHSRFKIPINIEGKFSCNISKQSSLASLIRDAKLIVWDEI
uniref:ATP-dependent DNA helicase n=1 Tax=Solanum lycopersicum TaxID=4081 RepID=A0A3Q7EVU2_SOLLC